jgi:hypothetical protein
VTLIPSVALATVRDDVVVRALAADAPTRGIWLARQDGGYVAPAAGPMRAILHRVAAEYAPLEPKTGGARRSVGAPPVQP